MVLDLLQEGNHFRKWKSAGTRGHTSRACLRLDDILNGRRVEIIVWELREGEGILTPADTHSLQKVVHIIIQLHISPMPLTCSIFAMGVSFPTVSIESSGPEEQNRRHKPDNIKEHIYANVVELTNDAQGSAVQQRVERKSHLWSFRQRHLGWKGLKNITRSWEKCEQFKYNPNVTYVYG